MLDFHPALSSAPVLLLLLVFLFETGAFVFSRHPLARDLQKTAKILLFVLAVLLPAVFYTGLLAADGKELSERAQEAVGIHYDRARLLLVSSYLTCLLAWVSAVAKHNCSLFRAAYRLALFAAVVIAVFTGAQGGALVFEYGVGVSPVVTQPH